MPCNVWFAIEKQYRIAVHVYSDAVNHLDSTRDFDAAWQHVESARTDADRARSALLVHQRKHLCVLMRGSSGHAEFSNHPAEESLYDELCLGDQGQPGG